MVRHGTNEAGEPHEAEITFKPARDVFNRDDDCLHCTSSWRRGNGVIDSPGDWNERKEPPTLTDCTGTSTTINATGTSTGSGATLLSNGDADFTQTAGSAGDPAGYYKLYTVCGSNGQQSIYDVRWHIVTPSPYVMQVTVSAKLQGSNNNAVLFSPTVSIRSMIGQGN